MNCSLDQSWKCHYTLENEAFTTGLFDFGGSTHLYRQLFLLVNCCTWLRRQLSSDGTGLTSVDSICPAGTWVNPWPCVFDTL